MPTLQSHIRPDAIGLGANASFGVEGQSAEPRDSGGLLPEVREGNDVSEVILGEKPTTEQEGLLERGRKRADNSTNAISDMLGKLITISLALGAAMFAAAKGEAINPVAACGAAGFFLLAASFGIAGVWPRTRYVNLNSLTDLEIDESESFSRKGNALVVSGIAFAFGMTVAFVGLVVRILPPIDAILPQ